MFLKRTSITIYFSTRAKRTPQIHNGMIQKNCFFLRSLKKNLTGTRRNILFRTGKIPLKNSNKIGINCRNWFLKSKAHDCPRGILPNARKFFESRLLGRKNSIIFRNNHLRCPKHIFSSAIKSKPVPVRQKLFPGR